ncbi:MAG: tRNA dihydrouridine synthase DusB [Clostridiales Family XIII bacterium]|jgi:tRNA-dihydrouridine synthase B|nr:tRNA dihydrouridine synthase DusB [Clostridiales Family XIII bacterium]
MNKLNIGNIKFNNNIFLAPMAGLTNLPLRLLAKQGGAGLVYTEMVSAKALVYGDEKTKKLLTILDEERPVAAQIFGVDTHSMSEAAKILEALGVDILDINLGCPVKKIVKAGAGAKLLTNEKLVSKILESVVKSVKIPVTIKIRIGLLPGQNIAPEIIKIAQDCGTKMVVVHARPASQGHSGSPDLNAFAQACSDAKIPVIGNGGISDEESASKFLKVPNCSGIMIGRGSIGNYSIFKRLKEFVKTGKKLSLPTKKEKIKWLKEHVVYSAKFYGEKKGLVAMRKVAHYYVKDMPNAAKIRGQINSMKTLEDFNNLLNIL